MQLLGFQGSICSYASHTLSMAVDSKKHCCEYLSTKRWKNMPQFSSEFWIQILIYAASFGVVFGQFQTKIKYLEQKLDKHNNVIERLYKLEASTKNAHERIDELKEEQR